MRGAVGQEGDKRNLVARNSAIEEELVKLVDCVIPESLLESQARERFAMVMAEQRASGVSDEDLKKMITKEGYEKYKKVAAKGVKKTLVSSLVVEELARREGIKFDQVAAEDQFQLMKVQAEQV